MLVQSHTAGGREHVLSPHLANSVINTERTDPLEEAVLAQKGTVSQSYCKSDFCARSEGFIWSP